MVAGFGFNIDIVYNPGNALTGLNQLNNVLLQSRTAAQAFAAGFAGIGGGLQNFEAPINRATGAITVYKEQVTSIVAVNTQAAASINRLVTTFTSAGQAISNSARLMTPFNATVAQIGNTAQTASTKFSAGLTPAIAAGIGPLASFNSQLSTTSGGLNNLGTSGGNAATGLGRLRELFTGNRGLVFGASALFGTLTGIAFELQLVNDANSQVAQSQAVLNGLVAAGQQGSAQYSQAQQALAKDQRFLEFSSRNLALAFTNLIPDVLLLINGLLNLSAKFTTTGAAAQALGTGITATQTTMAASTVATDALSASQTVLGTSTLAARDAITAEGAVITVFRTEEALAVGTTDALALSQGTLVTRTGEVLPAMTAAGGAMAAVRAEETFLVATNDALGASFAALGIKSEAAAVKIGGLRGLLSRVGGSIGGFLGGTGGAVLGPIALAGAFIGATEIIIQGAKETDQKILESGKIMDAFNKTTADSLDTLIDKVHSGTATMSEFWTAYVQGVQRSAGLIKAAQDSIPPPSLLGEKNLAAGTAGKPPDEGPIAGLAKWLGLGKIVSPESQAPPEGVKLPPPPTAPKPGPPKPAPTLQEGQRLFEQQVLRDQALLNTGKQLQIEGVGTFPLTKQFSVEDVAKLEEIIPKLKAARATIESGALHGQPEKEAAAIKDLMDTYDALAGVLGTTGFSMKSFGDASKDTAEAEKEKQKVYQKSQDDMNAYNKLLDAQPKILQDVGVATKQLSDDEIERQDIIRGNAAVFIGQANAQKVSLGVAEQAAAIGREITDGIIEQRDSILGANLVWGNMGTVIKGTNQTIGEWILSQQQASIAAVDVTQSLTNQTKAQYMANVGTLAGKQAARDFLDQTIIGIAQNAQYTESLKQIATTMGIQIPEGMKLTSAQLEQVIFRFRETGSAAGVFADIINERIQPAVQRLGDVLTAKNWKEFNDAFKGLEFGDAPDKLVSKFKDFDNMIRKINEDTREMQTVFDHLDIMQSLGKLDVKTFSQGLDAMAKQVEHIGKLQGIDVSNITTFLDTVAKTKDPTMVVKLHDILSLIAKDAENGFGAEEMKDLNFQISQIDVKNLEKFNGSLQTYLKILADIKKNKPGEVFFGGNEDVFSTKSKQDGMDKFTVYNIPKTPSTPKTPEDKFNSSVDKFAGAVQQFAGKVTPAPPFPNGNPANTNLTNPNINEFTTTPQQKDFLNRMNNATRNGNLQNYPYTTQRYTQPGDEFGDFLRGQNPQRLRSTEPQLPNQQPYTGGPLPASSGAGGIVFGSQQGAYGGPAKAQPSAADAFKGQDQLTPMVKQAAEMSKQIQTIYSSMFIALIGIVKGMTTTMTKEFNTMGVGITKSFTTLFTNVMEITGTFLKTESTAFASLGIGMRTSINLMGVAVTKSFTTLFTNVMEITGTFLKAEGTAFANLGTGIRTSMNTMGTAVTKTFTIFFDNVMEITGTFLKAEGTAFADLSTGIQLSMNKMGAAVELTFANTYANVMENTGTFIKTMTEAIQTMADAIVATINTMANDTVEMMVNMSNNVVTAIEDMADRGGAAADSFASDMESAMGTVETACNNAASAVSNLADEVAALDGSSAVVTVTTNFVTNGTPPKQTGDVTINRLMGAVINAASAKSFQFGGSIETSHGPQMAIFGDNPGGQETVAFIPHDNPFPTLRKLEKLFKGRSSSDIIDRALDKAEAMWIDLHLQIDNIMDGEKVSRQILRKTFKRMRTRP